jgi:enoyl-CoA hydratase/carnithine racemase
MAAATSDPLPQRLATLRPRGSEGFARLIGHLHAAIEQLHRMPHPVVGRVHGAVAGSACR